jgi:hypothetical protein
MNASRMPLSRNGGRYTQPGCSREKGDGSNMLGNRNTLVNIKVCYNYG